jgi:hypothetical protein
MGKIISLIISIGYVVAAVIIKYGKPGGLFHNVVVLAIYLLFPLYLIWFPFSLRGLGFWGEPRTSEEPEIIVQLSGWILLLFPAVLFMIAKWGR